MEFQKHDIRKLKEDIAFRANLLGDDFTFKSTWGLFSPTEIDEGTKFLLDYLEIQSGDVSLDIGCGYGALGLPIAKKSPQGVTHLVDKDFTALEYAKKNAALNGITNCEIYLSNGFSAVPHDAKFDLIVSNLPAKVGKELFWIFLDDAKRHLKPGGRIYVVTISGLREFIKRNFQEVFGNYEKVKQGAAYTVGKAVCM